MTRFHTLFSCDFYQLKIGNRNRLECRYRDLVQHIGDTIKSPQRILSLSKDWMRAFFWLCASFGLRTTCVVLRRGDFFDSSLRHYLYIRRTASPQSSIWSSVGSHHQLSLALQAFSLFPWKNCQSSFDNSLSFTLSFISISRKSRLKHPNRSTWNRSEFLRTCSYYWAPWLSREQPPCLFAGHPSSG